MPWALLIAGAAFAALTLHSLRPLRWPSPFVLGAWIWSWPVIELPLHALLIQVCAAATLVWAGAFDDWPGMVGIGLCAVSWLGLLRHVVLARATRVHIDRALTEGIGEAETSAPEPGERLRLARVLPIRRRGVERLRNLEYHRHERGSLRLDIYRHRDRPTGCPILLYTHGGGWVIGNKGQQGLVTINHMAQRGWLCIAINYRLSPRATFPDHLLDLKRAIRWVRENAAEYGGDPDCLVLVGGSAGAHLSALAALTPNAVEYQREFPDVDTSVQGCVAFYGVYDFTDRHGHWPHGGFKLLLERAIMKKRIADAPEDYANASPVDRIGPDAPPFFLLHGDLDNLAPVDEARRFAEAFRARATAPLAYAELPGAQHMFETFPSVRTMHVVRGVERFCAYVHARCR